MRHLATASTVCLVIVCASAALAQKRTDSPESARAEQSTKPAHSPEPARAEQSTKPADSPEPARAEQSAKPADSPEPPPIEPPPSAWDKKRAGEDGQPGPEPSEEISWTAQLAKTVVALLFVVALIYFLFKIGLARLLGYATVKSGGKALAIIDRAQLDARHALFLVELGPKNRLLVGTGERGVQVLARVDETGRPAGDVSATSFGAVIAQGSDSTGASVAHPDGGSDEPS